MTVLDKAAEVEVRSNNNVGLIVLDKATEVEVRSNYNVGLVVDPMDITFEDLTRDTVMIRVKIRNEGERRSSPTNVRLESAPFGAFVPWRPLAVLPVPALEPGESRELSVVATRPHPKPLGNFDRIPPARVLSALDVSPDEPSPQPGTGFAAVVLDIMERQGSFRSRKTMATTRGMAPRRPELPVLPPDLWQWFGREQPHWAGNINVFVGNRAVERHVAKALRIHSGRTNMAMFVVGGPGKRDAYSFELVGLAPDWKAALYDMTSRKTMVVRSSDEPVRERQWVEAASMMWVAMVVRPPMMCKKGNVQVHVTRRSCEKTAVVEFDLDPTAQGAGCYVV